MGFCKDTDFFRVRQSFFRLEKYFFLRNEKKYVLLQKTSTPSTMQAFILAAGLGTRLQPLTDKCPKALIKVQGHTLLEIAIRNLANQGISRVVVNIHHFADQMTDYIKSQNWPIPVMISDERNALLDTGGGLKKAADLFVPDEPIVIHNVDILSNLSFAKLSMQHTRSKSIATLVVSQRITSRYLLFNDKSLAGWRNHKTQETKWVNGPCDAASELAFDGIALINYELINLLPPPDHPYSIIPAYLEIARNHRIDYLHLCESQWMDVGKHETLALAQQWKLS